VNVKMNDSDTERVRKMNENEVKRVWGEGGVLVERKGRK